MREHRLWAMGRRLRSRTALLLAVAMTVCGLMAAAPVAAQASTSGCAPDIGTRTPVVYVHGFLGNPSAWTQMRTYVERNIPSTYPYVFDYSEHNAAWVSNPNIGPKLANQIACLASASRTAGGPGKVIVVAHSMGGLAARWAATESSNHNEVAKDIGLVVTIGTPNTGSGWANIFESQICTTLSEEQQAASFKAACNAQTALYGLQEYSDDIGALPKWPGNIAVQAMDGDVKFDIALPFGVHITVGNTHSDLIVSNKSALWGATRTYEGGGTTLVSCSMNVHVLNPTIAYLWQLFRHGVSLPNCWHSALPHNPAIEQATVQSIRDYLAWLHQGDFSPTA